MVANLIRAVRVLLLSCSLGLAQYDGPITPRINARVAREAMPAADLRVDVPLVLIPVHVTTPLGVSVTDLSKENFRVFEDGAEQQITHFASEDAPLSIGVLFDASGSMKNKIAKSAEAVAAFFRTSNTEDEFFLIEFNDRPKLAVPFTQDSEQIYKHIVHTRALGRTSLLDAIHLALGQMKNARNLRKAIVIVSDGGDNRSRYTESEVKAAMREADVQVYALGIFDPDDQPKRTREEKDGPRLLGELAYETGGRHYPVETLDELPGLCARIGSELRNQYLIGYAPTNGADDGRYRHVKVTVVPQAKMPPLRTHHRQGYYASSAPQ
jgi:Ca-activated chloride channel family protein